MGVSALELRRRVLMAQPHKERKTGGIVSFNTHVPQVLDVSVPLSPVQAGTGDPYPPGGGINLIDVADRTITLNDLYYVDVPTNFQLTAGETYTLSVDVTSTLEPFSVSVGCGVNSYTKDITSKYNNNNGHITLTFTPTEAQLEGRPYLFIRAPRYMTKQTATAEVKNFQLEKGSTAHDFAPYSNIRPISGHTGAAVWDDPKYGGLIKWNQLNALNAPNAWTTINEDGSVTITSAESTKTTYGHVSMLAETPFLSDHVYMLYTPGFFNNNGIRFYTARGSSDPIVAGKEARFYKNLASTQTFIRTVIPAHEGTVSVTTFVMLFDLTEMFGAEVADGIYSAPYETALSWFKSLFFKEWYPFNAGEITCVSAVNGETYRYQAFTFPAVGKNLGNFVDGYGIATNGTIVQSATRCATVEPIDIDQSKSYVVSGQGTGKAFIYSVWNGETLVRRVASRPSGSVLDVSGGTHLYVCMYENVTVEDNKPQVEIGSTPTAYEPYTTTVYGGRLEPAAGRLVVDRAKTTFNGSESWQTYTNVTYGVSYNIALSKKKIERNSSICDAFTNITDCWASSGKDKFGVFSDHNTLNRLYFRAPNASVDSLAGWKTWLSENPVTVVYYLAEPLIIPLSPAEIRALMGENNVFVDTGDVDVEFWTN